MTPFKCKMCGGDLELREGLSVAVCEYCGSKQTLPRLDDERRVNLYDRANHFRRNNEFDKAAGIYEQMLNEDKTDAEAYWSLVLCRYGIEYVEDPATRKRIPTINRAQFTSVFDDDNYKSALAYADEDQKAVYEAEAKAINEIQKGILAISQKEEPFDVFICYKETDNNGRRTPDSVLANELYHQLSQEGFKVFFSRITLEDKLGQEYEPYIFAALNSAKVMVVLGTKPEHFNAVWVKNEWSRYLALIRGGAQKILIPAYRDMDPYNLPEEFSHLQAQDMSRLGFMQDLIRGIKKITAAPTPQTSIIRESVSVTGNASIAPLLKRVFLFLEDGDWTSANEYCERVLDLDPESAEAYLGKLMAELHVRMQERLKDQAEPFDGYNNYQKAVRFANEDLKRTLYGYIDYINQRNETAHLTGIYRRAQSMMASAESETAYKEAAELFKSISHFEDAAVLAENCHEFAEAKRKDGILLQGKAYMRDKLIPSYEKAIQLFDGILDWKDAEELSSTCQKEILDIRQRAEAKRKDAILSQGKACMNDKRVSSYKKAMQLFDSIPDWKDAEELSAVCQKEIVVIRQRAKRNQKIGIRLMAVACGVLALAILLNAVIPPFLQARRENHAAPSAPPVTNTPVATEKPKEAEPKAQTEKPKKTEPPTQEEESKVVNAPQGTQKKTIETSPRGVIAIKTDGTIVATGDFLPDVYEFAEQATDIVEVYNGAFSSPDKDYVIGLRADGTVIAAGSNRYGQCNVEDWTEIVDISAEMAFTIGLRRNGTVVATGTNDYGQCDIEDWTDIVAVYTGGVHTIGLRKDGTVVATGANVLPQSDVEDWTDIVDIEVGETYTIGIRRDGTIVTAGTNNNSLSEIENWTDIVDIEAGRYGITGLRKDGTVINVRDDFYGAYDTSDWTDVVAISGDGRFVAGLRADGTVVATCDDDWCDVSSWTDIVAVYMQCDAFAIGYIIGLRADGTVVATGNNHKGRCDVGGWTDIRLPNITVETAETANEKNVPLHSSKKTIYAAWASTIALKTDGTLVTAGKTGNSVTDYVRELGENATNLVAISVGIVDVGTGIEHVMGLRENGTVVASGLNRYNQCEVENWTDIVAIYTDGYRSFGLRKDGTVVAVGENGHGQCDVESWTDIVAVDTGVTHTVGLRKDGSVVTVGENNYGQCDIESWTNIIAIYAEEFYTIGLRKDGSVVATGIDHRGFLGEVENWAEIAAIDAGLGYIAGLRKDGTVVIVSPDNDSLNGVAAWTDIVDISGNIRHLVGLRKDGSVVAVGDNGYGQCEVENWTDIVAIDAGGYGSEHTVGLRKDGTIIATGNNKAGRCDVEDWTDIRLPNT